jgi:hypothetical protein
MLDREQLDELSRLFAEKLFERYPEWEAAARHCPEQPLSFCVEWDSPVKGRSIGCTTENGEITVFFGGWHGHYGDWRGENDQEAVEEALRDVADILNDRAIVEATYRVGDCTGAGLVWLGENEPSSYVIAADAKVSDESSEETRIQSWSGRLDEVKKS